MMELQQLAAVVGCDYRGAGDLPITGVASLEKANGEQLSFLANPKYASQLKNTQAAAVVLKPELAENFEGAAILSDDPYLTFAKAAALFERRREFVPGIHPSAVIHETASIDPGAHIGPFCVIGENSRIGAGCILENHVSIGPDCRLGNHCHLKPQVTLVQDCTLGNKVLVHSGAVIGSDGFGLARDRDGWVKVPQLGGVRIGDNCEIGANTTIDRGTLEDTVLEEDVRLDNQIQIAHNVRIGAHTVMAGCSAVAGSARIGKNCLIGGNVGVLGHLQVCDNVTLQARTLVTRSITRPGSYSSAAPMQETAQWRRNAVRMRQLDELARSIKKLEKTGNV
jgi:UDP-3-O-[3-hydroxymyristoyl] glucosamine N-acyltransferase